MAPPTPHPRAAGRPDDLRFTRRLVPGSADPAPVYRGHGAAYTLTRYAAGGPAAGVRIGGGYATLDDAKLAARLEAWSHGRMIRGWAGAGPEGDAPAWAKGTTSDGRESYVVERVRAAAAA